MSDRQPATDKGTADRVEADNGGYWVRLMTKQALKREGECMENCLARGYHEETAGDEEMVSDAIWSLRRVDGISYLTVEVDVSYDRDTARIDEAMGPKNSQPSAWSCRQLRHLVAAFRDVGASLSVPEKIALTGEDGRTWRPDKAPQDLQDAVEARRKAEAARRANPYAGIVYGRIMVRPAGSDAPFTEVELVGGGASGFLPPGPASDVRDEASECPNGAVFYRAGPDEPFRALAGLERHDAILAAVDLGVIASYGMTNVVETVTVRIGGYPNRFMTTNEDGTYRLNLGDLVFPKVMPSGAIGMGDIDTLTFRIAPPPGRVFRGARLVPGDQPAFGFGAGGNGGVITEISSEFRMTSVSYRALVDGVAMLGGDGPGPGGGGS